MIGKVLAFGLVCAGIAVGQMATAPIAATTTTVPAKVYAFEVVSIRQNLYAATQHMGQPQFGPTPDGFSMTGMPLLLPILTAYVPQVGGAAFYENDQIKGIPDWLNTELYDIDARISDEGRAEWRKPESQKVMLRAMLQAMLVERCKIVVHRESKDSSVYLLVVGKSGPKFKETDPTAGHPPGRTLPGGATLVPGDNGAMRLYGVSMGMLATVLSSVGIGDLGQPIQDKTGLAGLYDVEIPRQDMSTADGQSLDPSEKVFATVEALGLKLESSKSSVETLVIDHIEKPSAN